MKINFKTIIFFMVNICFANIVFSMPTDQPSFNCFKATSEVDKAICNDRILSRLDRIMAGNFKLREKELSTDKGKKLLQEQRIWLSHRDDCLKKEKYLVTSCLVDKYKKRNFDFMQGDITDYENTFIILGDFLEFSDFIVYGKVNITPKFLDELSHAPIDDGGQFPNGIKSGDGKIMVKNCQNYGEHMGTEEENYGHLSYFQSICGIINQLKYIRKPRQSFIKEFYLTQLNYLPIDIFTPISSDDENKLNQYIAKGTTLAELLVERKIIYKKNTDYFIELVFPEIWQYVIIREIARGDFNDDGLEELLIDVYSHCTYGTYASDDLFLLSRDADNKVLKKSAAIK